MSESPQKAIATMREAKNSSSHLVLSTSLSAMGWKEGHLLKRDKGIIRYTWRDKFVILLEGSLFFYHSKANLTPKGVIHLNNNQVVDCTEKYKKKYSFAIVGNGIETVFAANSENEKLDWMQSIIVALNKSPSSPPDKDFVKKTKPSSIWVSGRLIDSITDLGASGKIAKEFITSETEMIMDSIKSFLTQYLGNEKAAKLEKQLISIAVKVALLYKEKHITKEYFGNVTVSIRLLISKLIDGYEIPFTFSPHEVIDGLREIQKEFEKIFRPFLHEKTILKMNQTFDMICDEDLIADFYTKRKWKECEVVGITLRRLWDGGAF